MARVLGAQQNTLRLWDNISDSELELHYRTPTTSERQGYANMVVQRHRNKVRYRQAEARLKYGLLILTGFREGDFARIKDGRPVPISADPASEHYVQDWKAHLERDAADVVMLLAAHVFDASTEIAAAEEEDGEDPNSRTTSPPSAGVSARR